MRHIPFKLYGLRLPVLLCVLLTLTATPAALAQQEIILGVGQQKTLSAKNIKRVVIGREEIAGVKVLENTKEILISGISEGSTNLIIWDKNDQKKSVMIQVVAQSP
ncbi:MAG: hypothetical protein GY868_06575, partial [Deltaproteobacteria bacterium]|nr:hypothetical protein [Deltaproteobacteria bacterium]